MTGTKGSGNNKKKKKAAATRPAGAAGAAVPVSAAAPPRVSSGASAVPTVPIVSPAGGAAALSAGSAPPPARAVGSAASTSSSATAPPAKAQSQEPETPLKKAQALKDIGNQQFNDKKYSEALVTYTAAIKLVPQGHKDGAVLYSNRAACHLLLKPVAFELVVADCTAALNCNPRFSKALIRRARAYEALQKWQEAADDAKALLQLDPKNSDALFILSKIEAAHKAAALKKRAALQAAAARAKDARARDVPVEETGGQNQVMMNDVMQGLAELVRARIGFDPMILDDSNLAEVNRAVEEAMTSEDAGHIFEQADAKFAQMAATLFISWGGLFRMMAERKSNPKKRTLVSAADTAAKADGEGTTAGDPAAAPSEETDAAEPKPAEEKAAAVAEKEANGETEEETRPKGEETEEASAKESVKGEESKVEGAAEGGAAVEASGKAGAALVSKIAAEAAAAAAEAAETEEERVQRELEDCNWAALKMDQAMHKFEDAIALQPGMVDGLTGVAQCLSDRARLAVRRAELALALPAGAESSVPIAPISHELALKVRTDFETALAKFQSADEILEKFEIELRDQAANPHLHHHHCTNPEHHHHHQPPPPPPLPANGDAPPRPLTPEEEEEALSRQQQIENVVVFRRQMVLNWLNAVTHAAGFEYLIGEDEAWKTDLELANKIMARVTTFGVPEVSQAAAALAALPAPLRQQRALLAAAKPADAAANTASGSSANTSAAPAVNDKDDKATDESEVAADAPSAAASDDKVPPVQEKAQGAKDDPVPGAAATSAEVALANADAAVEENAASLGARERWLEVWAKGPADKEGAEKPADALAELAAKTAEAAKAGAEGPKGGSEEKAKEGGRPEEATTEGGAVEGEKAATGTATSAPLSGAEEVAGEGAKGDAAAAGGGKRVEGGKANGAPAKGAKKKKGKDGGVKGGATKEAAAGAKEGAEKEEAAKDGAAKDGTAEEGEAKGVAKEGGAFKGLVGKVLGKDAAITIDANKADARTPTGNENTEEAMTPVKDLVGKFLAFANGGFNNKDKEKDK